MPRTCRRKGPWSWKTSSGRFGPRDLSARWARFAMGWDYSRFQMMIFTGSGIRNMEFPFGSGASRVGETSAKADSPIVGPFVASGRSLRGWAPLALEVGEQVGELLARDGLL